MNLIAVVIWRISINKAARLLSAFICSVAPATVWIAISQSPTNLAHFSIFLRAGRVFLKVSQSTLMHRGWYLPVGCGQILQDFPQMGLTPTEFRRHCVGTFSQTRHAQARETYLLSVGRKTVSKFAHVPPPLPEIMRAQAVPKDCGLSD